MKRRDFYIAAGVIVVPVLLIFTCHLGRQKMKHLPIYGEKIAPETAGQDTIYYQVPDFHVTDQTGAPISQKNFTGSIYVANFFFASCKDVCPKMNKKVQKVYDTAKEYAEVKFISFTVDPENDSVPVLAGYAKRFEADPKIWHFVTGSKDDIFKAGQGFLLPVSKEDKTIDHSQQLLLIDKQNRIRGIYDGLEDAEVKRLGDEIKVLLYEYHEDLRK